MSRNLIGGGSVIGLCGILAFSVALAADRSAQTILTEIEAIKISSNDSKDSAEIARNKKLIDQKARLILELYKASPTNPELARLMPDRWQSRPVSPASTLATKAEIDEILLKNKNAKLVVEASYYKTTLAIKKAGTSSRIDDVLTAIDDFARRAPQDDRVSQLLYQVATNLNDKTKQAALFERIQKDYPESPSSKKIVAKSQVLSIPANRDEMIGQPFVLAFSDAIKGSEISIEGLKGKVVVIDFWATWCGPCVKEMPTMKELYAKYKDQGVEFIGVSLDYSREKGGLDALKTFVAQNKIEWPQYYQGNFWQSEFSSAWHVNGIPCVFLVDANGRLASTNARGKLATMLPEYLAKAKAGSNPTPTRR